MKRILIVSQYFYPENFKINEIAVGLVKHGYAVDVVTGLPNYPSGVIANKYRYGKNRNQKYNGVNIHRVHIIARKRGSFFRILNYLSFAYSAARYLKKQNTKYDLTFVYQLSPVLMIYPSLKIANKKIVYCLDIWPESLKAMHISENSLLFHLIHRISKKLYHSVDKILVSSQSFMNYLFRENDISKKDMTFLPQHSLDMKKSKDNGPKMLDNDKKFHFIFTGNIGNVQDIETIIKAAKIASKSNKFIVDIVGEGTNYQSMRRLAETSHTINVKFHGRKPADLMPQYYYEADCCLLTLRNDSEIGLTIPSKLQTYMSSGRPILAAIDGDSRTIITDANCGICVRSSAASELAKAMDKFVELPKSELVTMGNNARNYYLSNFTIDIFMTRLIHIFEGEIKNGN